MSIAWLAAAWLAIIAAPVATSVWMMSRSSSTKTSRHTREVYHGNWWPTWHRPGDLWVYAASCAVAVLATILGTAAVLTGIV